MILNDVSLFLSLSSSFSKINFKICGFFFKVSVSRPKAWYQRKGIQALLPPRPKFKHQFGDTLSEQSLEWFS